MNFGVALSALKEGARVTRAGWNGRGMWLVLARGSDIFDKTDAEVVTATVNVNLAAPPFEAKVRSCIVMFNAQGEIVPGWLASQTDMLAEDWMIVLSSDDDDEGEDGPR